MEPSLLADLVAERAVLGAILMEPAALLAVRWLRITDFSLERYSWIYEAACECLDEQTPPDLVTVSMESGPHGTPPLRRIDEGGLLQLEHELQRHEGVRLIVIDTLTCLAPMGRGRGNPYLEDYSAYLPLRDFAQRHSIAVLGSWHYNKAGSPDPMELVSGSMGLPAIAINRIGIVRERGEADGTLYSFSKRGLEVEWRLRFDGEIVIGGRSLSRWHQDAVNPAW